MISPNGDTRISNLLKLEKKMYQSLPEMQLQPPMKPSLSDSNNSVVINRRMLALLPHERFARTTMALSSGMTILQQLLNFEAQRLTGCVKIEAPRFMSRAGILIVRGKVLACVYGSKSVPCQL